MQMAKRIFPVIGGLLVWQSAAEAQIVEGEFRSYPNSVAALPERTGRLPTSLVLPIPPT